MKITGLLSILTISACIFSMTACSQPPEKENVPSSVETSSSERPLSDASSVKEAEDEPDFIEAKISEEWTVTEYPGLDLGISEPAGIACGNGKIFVCDTANDRIAVFDSAFNPLDSIGSTGNKDGCFSAPSGLAVQDDKLYVLDSGNNRLQVLNLDGSPVSSQRLLNFSAGQGQNQYYSHLAIPAPDEIVFTVYDLGGDAKIYRLSGGEIEPISDVFLGSVDAADGKTYAINLYEFTKMSAEETTAESGENSLLIFDGDTLESQVELPYMYSIADFVVADDQLYVLSSLWNRLDHFDLQGNYIETIAQFSFDPDKPVDAKSSLTYDEASSTFYVAARDNDLIYEVKKLTE